MPKETMTDEAEQEKPEAKPEQAKPDGGPNWQRAAEDYKAQRDAARQQFEELQTQFDELRGKVEGLKTAEDVQKAVDEAVGKANEDFEAAKAGWADREKSLVVGAALAEGGCIDTKALMGHIDLSGVTVKDGKAEGVDVAALKGSYPYLFGKREQAGSTDAQPKGAASSLDERIDKAFDIK